MIWMWITIGLALLVVGAEVMIRGASRVAQAAGISPLVVGLTVVAFGTSSPELVVSIESALLGRAGVGVGNVVGSNIANIWLILGASALVAPMVVRQSLVRLEVPLLILVSLGVIAMAFDATITRVEGLVLLVVIVSYTIFAIYRSRSASRAVEEEYEASFEAEPPAGLVGWLVNLLLVGGGLALLIVGGRWLVDGAVEIARNFGVDEAVVGLTVVAVGTSLPELATSVVSALRGEQDIAVGNLVGSNLFNLTCVLGGTALVAPDGVGIPQNIRLFDLPVMLAASVACLPIFLSGRRIDRWEGGVFLGYFVAYTTYLVLEATGSAAAPTFRLAVLAVGVPMTVVVLVAVYLRARDDSD